MKSPAFPVYLLSYVPPLLQFGDESVHPLNTEPQSFHISAFVTAAHPEMNRATTSVSFN